MISFAYGIALTFIQQIDIVNKKNIKNIVELILAFACLTSIDFMSEVFEVNHCVELLCYLIISIIVILIPICVKKYKSK